MRMWVAEEGLSGGVEARAPMSESPSQLSRGHVEVVVDQICAESSSLGLLVVARLLMISRTISP